MHWCSVIGVNKNFWYILIFIKKRHAKMSLFYYPGFFIPAVYFLSYCQHHIRTRAIPDGQWPWSFTVLANIHTWRIASSAKRRFCTPGKRATMSATGRLVRFRDTGDRYTAGYRMALQCRNDFFCEMKF